ncbi:hypothetical protein [Pseudomonas sp. C2B4]|uniref:hypothetical protein n=1 Tax=Pseudomonas sp. C2B4 TaxID=2735270 RepID=UPI00158611C8|nr:hypothetical protein [Pseudomonas sp. C2B4]NUU39453.1 hypothetical protein [Pseudomonas sp. C2B4]
MLSPGTFDYLQELKSQSSYSITLFTLHFPDGSTSTYTPLAYRSSPDEILITGSDGKNFWLDVSPATHGMLEFVSEGGRCYVQVLSASADVATYKTPWVATLSYHVDYNIAGKDIL